MARRCSALCCIILSSIVGVLLLIAGGVFVPVSKNLIHGEIKKVKLELIVQFGYFDFRI